MTVILISFADDRSFAPEDRPDLSVLNNATLGPVVLRCNVDGEGLRLFGGDDPLDSEEVRLVELGWLYVECTDPDLLELKDEVAEVSSDELLGGLLEADRDA